MPRQTYGSDTVVEGVFSMPAVEGESNTQTLLTLGDMETIVKDLIDAPLRIEHGKEIAGIVEHAEIDPKTKCIRGRVRLNKGFSGERAAHLCRTGHFRGFSLGLDHMTGRDADGLPIITEKRALHVALANEPEMAEHAIITHVTPLSEERQRELEESRARITKARSTIDATENKLSFPKLGDEGDRLSTVLNDSATVHLTTYSSKSATMTDQTATATATPATPSAAEQIAALQKQLTDLQSRVQPPAKASETEANATLQAPPERLLPPAETRTSHMNIDANGVPQWQQKAPGQSQSSPLTFNFNMGQTDREQAALQERDRRSVLRKRGREEEPEVPAEATGDKLSEVQELRKRMAEMEERLQSFKQQKHRLDQATPHPSQAEQMAHDATTEEFAEKINTAKDQSIAEAQAEIDEDEDVEDKTKTLSIREIKEEHQKLRNMYGEIQEMRARDKEKKDTALQDRIKRKFKKYEAHAMRTGRHLRRHYEAQLAKTNIPLDSPEAHAILNMSNENLAAKKFDQSFLDNMGTQLLVSTLSNATNGIGLKQANEQLARERQKAAEMASRNRVLEQRAQLAATGRARDDVMMLDPKPMAPVRKLTPAARVAAPVQPAKPAQELSANEAFMKNSGISWRLAAPNRNLDAISAPRPKNPLGSVPFEVCAPRRRVHGLQFKHGKEDRDFVLRMMDEARTNSKAALTYSNAQQQSAFSPNEHFVPVNGRVGMYRVK